MYTKDEYVVNEVFQREAFAHFTDSIADAEDLT
jgi:hypothetical protein